MKKTADWFFDQSESSEIPRQQQTMSFRFLRGSRFNIHFSHSLPLIYILISSLSILCINAEHAKVYFPFIVHPTYGGYEAIYNVDSRNSFPKGDILISEISFIGVGCNGKKIPYHAHSMMHGSSSEMQPMSKSVDLMFHHSILHQGSLDDMDGTWKHFTQNDNTTWSHGAIMYGTEPKRTSFMPYGIRMRQETPIFTCMHSKNNLNITVEFLAEWEIEYEYINNVNNDHPTLVTGWYSMPPVLPMPRHHDQIRPMHILFEMDLPLIKNVSLKGYILHHHGWLYELVGKVNQRSITLFKMSQDDVNYPIPDEDDTVIWIYSDDRKTVTNEGIGNVKQNLRVNEREKNSLNKNSVNNKFDNIGIPIYEGEDIQIEIIAEVPQDHNVGPLGLSLYFTCDDGTDYLKHMNDIHLKPRYRAEDQMDSDMFKKVALWNRYLFKDAKHTDTQSVHTD